MPDYPQLDWEYLYQSGTTPWDNDSPWSPLARLVQEVCPPGASILEVGCGHGVDAIHLAALGYRVKATDLSATAIGRARAAVHRAGVAVDFQVEDFYTSRDETEHDLLYEKGVMVNANNAEMWVEFSRLAASRLTDGGCWVSVSGNSDNLNVGMTGPDKRGYPRLSVLELASVVEPYFEIQSITQEAFGSTPANSFQSWVVISRKRRGTTA
jgi:SAM-dependent methyltransferase